MSIVERGKKWECLVFRRERRIWLNVACVVVSECLYLKQMSRSFFTDIWTRLNKKKIIFTIVFNAELKRFKMFYSLNRA